MMAEEEGGGGEEEEFWASVTMAGISIPPGTTDVEEQQGSSGVGEGRGGGGDDETSRLEPVKSKSISTTEKTLPEFDDDSKSLSLQLQSLEEDDESSKKDDNISKEGKDEEEIPLLPTTQEERLSKLEETVSSLIIENTKLKERLLLIHNKDDGGVENNNNNNNGSSGSGEARARRRSTNRFVNMLLSSQSSQPRIVQDVDDGNDRDRNNENEEEEKETSTEQYHPHDTYSYLITMSKFSYAWVLSLFVFMIQNSLFLLVFQSHISVDGGSSHGDGDDANWLGIPENVSVSVRFTQAIAILIAVVLEDDFRIGIERLQEGCDFRSKVNFPSSSKCKWYWSHGLRICSSLFGLATIFVMIVHEEEVFQLLLDFTGLGFVSQIDEIIFALSNTGFLGKSLSVCTGYIVNNSYHVSKNAKTPSWVRRWFFYIVLLIMYIFYAFVVAKQSSGSLFSDTLYVAFKNPIINPSLATYSGVYKRQDHLYNRRPVYTMENILLTSKKNHPKTVYTAFFNDMNKWKFGICEDDVGSTTGSSEEEGNRHEEGINFNHRPSYCQVIAETIIDSRSHDGGAGEYFDIRDTDDEFWVIPEEGNSDLLQKIEFTKLTRADDALSAYKCNDATGLGQCSDACKQLSVIGANTFPADGPVPRALEFSILSSGFTTAYDHPVYWGARKAPSSSSPPSPVLGGKNTENDTMVVYDVIIYTGRQWVLTDTERLNVQFPPTTSQTTNTSQAEIALTEFFGKGFHALQLEASDSIIAVSEEVPITLKSPVHPVGLRWYSSIYNSNTTATTDTLDLDWFPTYDATSPADIVVMCSYCNEKTNPCNYEGTCNENDGTCSCKNRATGKLCEVAPIEDGVCDLYFNEPLHGYDGGDCCGFTCEGFLCETPLPNFTFTHEGRENYTSYLVTGGLVETDQAMGFPNCIDPSMVQLSMDITGGIWEYDAGRGTLKAYSAEIICNSKRVFFVGLNSIIYKLINVSIQVPAGAECEVILHHHDWEYGTMEEDHEYSLNIRYDGTDFNQSFTGHRCNDDSDLVTCDLIDQKTYLKFSVLSPCIRDDLILNRIDLSDIRDLSSPQAQGAEWINALESASRGYICGRSDFKQNYAMSVLSSAGTFKEASPCRWSPHATCDNKGRVISLDLRDWNEEKAGHFVPEIGLLEDLEFIRINSYNFTGSIPSTIGLLSNLRLFLISDGNTYGTIPSEIGMLTQLRYDWTRSLDDPLRINGTIPVELFNLRNLSTLILDSLSLTGTIPTEVGLLTKLTELRMSHARALGNGCFTGRPPAYQGHGLDPNRGVLTGTIPSELAQVQGLEMLLLDYNNLTGSIPSKMAQLTNLQKIVLRGNDLSGPIPSEWGELESLVLLALDRNVNMDRPFPETIVSWCAERKETVDGYNFMNDYNGCIWNQGCGLPSLPSPTPCPDTNFYQVNVTVDQYGMYTSWDIRDDLGIAISYSSLYDGILPHGEGGAQSVKTGCLADGSYNFNFIERYRGQRPGNQSYEFVLGGNVVAAGGSPDPESDIISTSFDVPFSP